jgi:predicted nucleic acid-binding protein
MSLPEPLLRKFRIYAATRNQSMTSLMADSIPTLTGWSIHRPGYADLSKAAALHRRHKIAWWDAPIVKIAIELGCRVLWTEDLAHGQRYGSLTVRNPFR